MIIRSIVFNDSFSLLFIGDYRIGKLAYCRNMRETFWDIPRYKKAKNTKPL